MFRVQEILLAGIMGLAASVPGGLYAKDFLVGAANPPERGWLTLSLHQSGGVSRQLAGAWHDVSITPTDGAGPLTLSPRVLDTPVMSGTPPLVQDGDDGLPLPAPPVEKMEKAPLLKMELPDDGSWITNVVDYESVDQQGFTADMVRFVLPVGRRFQPLVAFGHQYTDLNDNGRFGVGTGARWLLGPGADFGTQLMVFPSDPSGNDLDGMNRHEVRAMARFSINF